MGVGGGTVGTGVATGVGTGVRIAVGGGELEREGIGVADGCGLEVAPALVGDGDGLFDGATRTWNMVEATIVAWLGAAFDRVMTATVCVPAAAAGMTTAAEKFPSLPTRTAGQPIGVASQVNSSRVPRVNPVPRISTLAYGGAHRTVRRWQRA